MVSEKDPIDLSSLSNIWYRTDNLNWKAQSIKFDKELKCRTVVPVNVNFSGKYLDKKTGFYISEEKIGIPNSTDITRIIEVYIRMRLDKFNISLESLICDTWRLLSGHCCDKETIRNFYRTSKLSLLTSICCIDLEGFEYKGVTFDNATVWSRTPTLRIFKDREPLMELDPYSRRAYFDCLSNEDADLFQEGVMNDLFG